MGRAAGGGSAAQWGMGKIEKVFIRRWLSGSARRTGHTQEDQNREDCDAGGGHSFRPEPFRIALST